MNEVPFRCHRCWKRLTEPLGDDPPFSYPTAAPCGTAILMLLCGACRDAFTDDAAREGFLERMSRLVPIEASAPTDAGVRTLVWEPGSARLPNRHRKFAVVKPEAPYPW
jgi:hypothetical protein